MSYILLFSFLSFLFLGASCNYMRAHLALYSFWDHLHYGRCFFLTIRARRRRAEIFYRRKCHSFPYQFTDFFFFWFLQSRTKFSLSFPDRRATYVVEVLRPHLRHPIIIIQTLPIDSETRFLLNSYSTSPTSISTSTSSSLSLATTSHLRLTRFDSDYWQSSLLLFGLIVT